MLKTTKQFVIFFNVANKWQQIAGSLFAEDCGTGSGLNTFVFVAIIIIVVAGPRWESWFTISFSTIMFTAKTALNDLCIPMLKEVCNTYFCRNSTIFWSKANISQIYFRFLMSRRTLRFDMNGKRSSFEEKPTGILKVSIILIAIKAF